MTTKEAFAADGKGQGQTYLTCARPDCRGWTPGRAKGQNMTHPSLARPIFSHGTRVGLLERDHDGELRLVKRRVDPSRHQLKKPPSWATDQVHLDELRFRGGAGVRIITVYGVVFEASLETFDRFALNRGHGPQVALPLTRWTTRSSSARQATRGVA